MREVSLDEDQLGNYLVAVRKYDNACGDDKTDSFLRLPPPVDPLIEPRIRTRRIFRRISAVFRGVSAGQLVFHPRLLASVFLSVDYDALSCRASRSDNSRENSELVEEAPSSVKRRIDERGRSTDSRIPPRLRK